MNFWDNFSIYTLQSSCGSLLLPYTIQDCKYTHVKKVTQQIMFLKVNDNRHKKNSYTKKKTKRWAQVWVSHVSCEGGSVTGVGHPGIRGNRGRRLLARPVTGAGPLKRNKATTEWAPKQKAGRLRIEISIILPGGCIKVNMGMQWLMWER